MPEEEPSSYAERLKKLLAGKARDLHDKSMYHKLALAAFLAWVGLGSDGLSSSCYGPPEAFVALGKHTHLGVFVALATAVTIIVISTSYSQIIELFPSGGGGYLVASKLLSERTGAVAGCALLVDYVLTIAISVASGADALFSFLPLHSVSHQTFEQWKLAFAVATVLALTVLNIRGVKESVAPLVPIFLVFVLSHAFLIVYAMGTHVSDFGDLARSTVSDVRTSYSQLGLWGMILLIMHSYSMGAGTYTGIEAVSNGMPLLREPRVHTAKRTMTFMWVSLALAAVGLMLAYLLYHVQPEFGKSLNAVLLEQATSSWNATAGRVFVIVTLVSEAAILVIAAQTGFLGGPRILANMALDRWFPARFSLLSDRLVTHNGVVIMATAAIITMLWTGGSVDMLVVLYSINVFITFVLSQAGMVRHWWISRRTVPDWRRRLLINTLGLVLCSFILVWVSVVKFTAGGWATLVVTTALVVVASLIRRHYNGIAKQIRGFNKLAQTVLEQMSRRAEQASPRPAPPVDPQAKTAVVLVGGFNALGLHSVQNVIRYFGESFRNFVFVSVGIVDAGNFKGAAEVSHLEEHTREQIQPYADLMRNEGYYAESFFSVGTDLADEISSLAPKILEKFPNSIFFAGQLIFPKETFFTRLLHNNITFQLQKRLYRQGIPFVILPFRV